MPPRIVHALLAIALGLGGGMAAKWVWLNYGPAAETEIAAAQDIAWSALVPLGAEPRRTAGPGRRGMAALSSPVPGAIPAQSRPSSRQPVPADAAFMSEPVPRPPADAPVVADLDGLRVRIAGYAVPLDLEARRVTEFLLVPYVGACIHVPPPPANQIVHVVVPAGVEIPETFAPVAVTGRLAVQPAATRLAAVGYRIDDARVALVRP